MEEFTLPERKPKKAFEPKKMIIKEKGKGHVYTDITELLINGSDYEDLQDLSIKRAVDYML